MDKHTLHPDDEAVDRFAGAMKTKLASARAEGRSGWEDKAQCSREHLLYLLRKHVEKGDPIDVANFAMMLHQRGEAIAKAEGQRMTETPTVPPRIKAGDVVTLNSGGMRFTVMAADCTGLLDLMAGQSTVDGILEITVPTICVKLCAGEDLPF